MVPRKFLYHLRWWEREAVAVKKALSFLTGLALLLAIGPGVIILITWLVGSSAFLTLPPPPWPVGVGVVLAILVIVLLDFCFTGWGLLRRNPGGRGYTWMLCMYLCAATVHHFEGTVPWVRDWWLVLYVAGAAPFALLAQRDWKRLKKRPLK